MIIQICKILLSLILGFFIGLERKKHGKSIGIKTFSLICIGSTLFCLIAVSNNTNDYSRITAQIVSGIGFLGAGIIFKDNNHEIPFYSESNECTLDNISEILNRYCNVKSTCN